MLRCFADYNNESGRGCAVAVTDDYSTTMFFLQYEARSAATAELGSALGAIVNWWIKARGASHRPPTNDREFIAQACVDGEVFSLHTWSSDGD